jgi:Fe-S-cluster containining protein
MAARLPSNDGSELYDRTVAQLTSRLRRMRTPHQLMGTLRWGAGELDRAYANAPAEARAAVACREGCAACCHVAVDVQAHEVLYAADHIQVSFSPQALNEAVERLDAHRSRVAAFTAGERDQSRQACALLQTGACTIYAGRPQPCRSHHTSDAAACAAHLTNPSLEITAVYIPALRARMFSVMLGVDEAIEAAGYDERAYDFGSALHEALTNPLCLDAWMRHRSAFPDNCLAEPPIRPATP